MARHLNVGVMITSAEVPTENPTIEKYCYDDNLANCDTYGGLYTFDEAMDYSPSDAANPSTTQCICPYGWHMPSDEEVKVLEMELGMTSKEANMSGTFRGEGPGIGTALKVSGSYGFEMPYSGRFAGTFFDVLGSYGFLLTSTESLPNIWRRCFRTTSTGVGRYDTYPKSYGLSVRCVFD